MKRIVDLGAGLVLLVLLCVGCKKELPNYQQIPTTDAFRTTKDVQNGLIGCYNLFGTYEFAGRNVIAVGDMCGTLGKASPASGHFVDMNNLSISPVTPELAEMWARGYQILDACTRTIIGGKALINDKLSKDPEYYEGDILTVNSCIGQAYGLRALTELYLVNLFGKRYEGNQDALGIILVPDDKPIEKGERVSRATVAKVYEAIFDDLKKADEHFKGETEESYASAFYIGVGTLQAIAARAYLYKADYKNALDAAKAALKAVGIEDLSGEPLSGDAYLNMFRSLAIEPKEHIFLLAKSSDDNLSADALNTLYGSYKATVKVPFDTAADMRNKLVGEISIRNQPLKWAGIPGEQAVSNIPIFRVSEMALIEAEAALKTGDDATAKEALLFVAKRGGAEHVANVETLWSGDEQSKLAAIKLERRLELFAEGHDFYDMRRWGDVAKGGKHVYDLSRYAFPIPDGEISADFGTEPTPVEDYLPIR